MSRFFAATTTSAQCRIALSGTPLAHSPLDAYGIYRWLDPSIFGRSFVQFRAQYAVMGGYGNHEVLRFQNLNDLHQKMYSIAFRVTKEVLDLPPLRHEDIPVTLGPQAQALYNQLEADFYAKIRDGGITLANALVRTLRLRQICSGHCTLDDGTIFATDDAKINALNDLLDGLDEREPLVVFAQFRPDLWAIKDAVEKSGRRYAELSGERNDLEKWQAGQADVIGVQIQAGGLGVDLTRSRYVVFYSINWSYSDYEQALARTHRGGQTRAVMAYHLVCENTIEPTVYQALQDKKDVIGAVIDRVRQ